MRDINRRQERLKDHQSIQELNLVTAAIDDSTWKGGEFFNDLSL